LNSAKSSNKILYACDHFPCPVIMFICVVDNETDTCPKCGMIGLKVRGPVDTSIEDRREEIRREQREADERSGREPLQDVAYKASVAERGHVPDSTVRGL